jgi:hypothetical protein
MRHRIFVGSSSEDLTLAEGIQYNLVQRGHRVKVWNQGIFAVQKTALDSLLDALESYDAAVFVFAPADLVSIRGHAFEAVRDNVVFELGLFTGKLGRDRTFWVTPRGQEKLRIASDLLGVLPAEYAEPADRDWRSALAVPCQDIHQALVKSAQTRSRACLPLPEEATRTCITEFNKALEVCTSAMASAVTAGLERVEALPNDAGFRIKLSRKSELRVTFGCIEECRGDEAGSVVALPANEFFDDACMTDPRSALGAFARKHFGERIEDLRKLVAKQLEPLQPVLVQNEMDSYLESYGVGTALFLQPALPDPLILCAVTRKRAGEGIRAEPAYVFAAVRSISRIMNDKKLTTLYVPLLGAGHGDMCSEVALGCLVLALLSTPHIRCANIVVFRRPKDGETEVSPEVVRKILGFAVTLPEA